MVLSAGGADLTLELGLLAACHARLDDRLIRVDVGHAEIFFGKEGAHVIGAVVLAASTYVPANLNLRPQ